MGPEEEAGDDFVSSLGVDGVRLGRSRKGVSETSREASSGVLIVTRSNLNIWELDVVTAFLG